MSTWLDKVSTSPFSFFTYAINLINVNYHLTLALVRPTEGKRKPQIRILKVVFLFVLN